MRGIEQIIITNKPHKSCENSSVSVNGKTMATMVPEENNYQELQALGLNKYVLSPVKDGSVNMYHNVAERDIDISVSKNIIRSDSAKENCIDMIITLICRDSQCAFNAGSMIHDTLVGIQDYIDCNVILNIDGPFVFLYIMQDAEWMYSVDINIMRD